MTTSRFFYYKNENVSLVEALQSKWFGMIRNLKTHDLTMEQVI